MNKKYIGYNPPDFATAYAQFFKNDTPQAQASALSGLSNSPFPLYALLSFENREELANDGYHKIENGYAFEADGSASVAVLTPMPNVQPKMWDWWFGWHGCADNRYKLWHPKAHLSAEWLDGNQQLETYIGRTSVIQERIGIKLEKANIQFVAPESLRLKNGENTLYICARLGYTNYPLNFGWLVHQIRSTPEGAEMRSRFWIGGKHISIRKQGAFFGFLSKILQKTYRLPRKQPADLLTHCSEEMSHLASFLPEIYKEFKFLLK
ncbi:MAG: hypothetical protein RI894_2221 [Bacteroidota bacterium]|jgi:hypothetical protein